MMTTSLFDMPACNKCGRDVAIPEGSAPDLQVLSCMPVLTPYTKKNQTTKIESTHTASDIPAGLRGLSQTHEEKYTLVWAFAAHGHEL